MGLNDEVLYVLEGTTTFLIGETWVDVDKGTFLGIHTKTNHNTMNTTRNRTGVLDIIIPDGFERNMPSIVKWFEGGREV